MQTRQPNRTTKNLSLNKWKAVCAIFLFCAAAAIAAPAQTFTTLATFDGTDGNGPSGLVQGNDGNFYGTTEFGGANEANCVGLIAPTCGTVFKMTPKGVLTTLYNFCSQPSCTDGANPSAGLIQAADGTLYGTTALGGSPFGDCPDLPGGYCGTVFKINPGGTLTVLATFGNGTDDGAQPQGALIQGTDGNFYGTTFYEGGTVFKMTPGGVLTNICGPPNGVCDGFSPSVGAVVQGTDGNQNLYGAISGYPPPGNSDCPQEPVPLGCGKLFKITPAGFFTITHKFCAQANCADGASPNAPLVQGDDGSLYGTTSSGGTNFHGVAFKITPAGTFTILHRFCAQPSCTDGSSPGGFILASDGNFYGLTPNTIFRMTPAGIVTTIYSFSASSLAQGTDGNFYGTAGNTIFRLSVGLGPFVLARPGTGKVGETVAILGNDLTGTTSVSFNGTAASFTVVSATEITAKVPACATTGKIDVTTPSGTLTSNQSFRVRPQIFGFSPTSGPVGTRVVVTGESFTRAAAVTLAYEWPMSFTVNSDTQITATIPTGATTGEISIRDPGGVAHSTTKFTVTP
jgi:uncharacterized repeat protein (TIGR03803 family)